ncbi:LysE family translocator [Acetobacter sp. DmW_136]|nr:LysE family translocator [Acetobacter sp. DmW_136]
MPVELLAAFWAVSMLFVLTPGADWAYSISAGLCQHGIIPAITGLLLGHLAATLLVAAGVAALVASVPMAMTVLTVIGAAYLVWLGYGMLTAPASSLSPKASAEQRQKSRLNWIMRGFCISGLNPKVFLLFLALLPQFTSSRGTWPISLQILTLGWVHICNCGAIYLLVGFGARAVISSRPQAAILVSRFSGVTMIVIAALLVAEQCRH